MNASVQVELIGGPLDGERRTIEEKFADADMVFLGAPRPDWQPMRAEWTDATMQRHVYRPRMTALERATVGRGVGRLRFDYQYPKRKLART